MNILDYIHEGKEDAITREELRFLTELSDRTIRELIEQERRNGVIILNLQDGRGYYRPAPEDLVDILKQYRQNDSRAKSILVQQKYLRRILKFAGVKV